MPNTEGDVYSVTALGLWLPCGRANFFDFELDSNLVQGGFDSNVLEGEYELSELDIRLSRTGVSPEKSDEALHSSVYRRLVTVLRDKGFTHAYPIMPPSRIGFDQDTDPDAIFLQHPGTPTYTWPAEVRIQIAEVVTRAHECIVATWSPAAQRLFESVVSILGESVPSHHLAERAKAELQALLMELWPTEATVDSLIRTLEGPYDSQSHDSSLKLLDQLRTIVAAEPSEIWSSAHIDIASLEASIRNNDLPRWPASAYRPLAVLGTRLETSFGHHDQASSKWINRSTERLQQPQRSSAPMANLFDLLSSLYRCGPFEWPAEAAIDHLCLLSSADGFYLWMAAHQGERGDLVAMALRDYIAVAFGGTFFSHYSGHMSDSGSLTREERLVTIEDYREMHLGILTFFQLNTILEGMFNSSFDPQVFFYDDLHSLEVKRAKHRHSVGAFARMITTSVNQLPDRREWMTASILRRRMTAGDGPIDGVRATRPNPGLSSALNSFLKAQKSQKRSVLQRQRSAFLSDQARNDILRQFYRSTITKTLQAMKWRIERCRRALLSEMIGITQRSQPLVQVETPDYTTDLIRVANEAQLRGYIMLVAAKLPIISNVRRYLEDVRRDINVPTERDATSSFAQSWSALLDAVESNILGLERAVEHARMDSLVYEEEQIRAEQETAAEIGRVRERTGPIGNSEGNGSNGVLGHFIELVAVFVAVLALYYTNASSNQTERGLFSLDGGFRLGALFERDTYQNYWSEVFTALAWVALIFFVLHFLFVFLSWAVSKTRLFLRADRHRYYYELDFRLDASITAESAKRMISANFDTDTFRPGRFSTKVLWARTCPGLCRLATRLRVTLQTNNVGTEGLSFSKPKRTSYRVERLGREEAVHKIHLESAVIWSGGWRRSLVPYRRQQRVSLFVILELLSHRPADIQTYILRDVRVFATPDHTIDGIQLRSMKFLAMEVFVNNWMTRSQDCLVTDLDSQDADPTLALSSGEIDRGCIVGRV